MGQAGVRVGEGGQRLCAQRRTKLFQRTAHHPEVQGAHELAMRFGEFEERAVAKPDLGASLGFGRGLRLEADVGQQIVEPGEPVLGRQPLAGRRRRDEVTAPHLAGTHCRADGVVLGGQMTEQHLGQQFVVARTATVHAGGEHVLRARSSWPVGATLLASQGAVADQRVEMEAHGVHVQTEFVGDLLNAQRTVARAEEFYDLPASSASN